MKKGLQRRWRQAKTPQRVISSAVERFVHIEDVSGSNPLSPTMFLQGVPPKGAPCHFRAPVPGRLAQLVEHLVYTEIVGGSSPSPPTII